MLKTVKCALVAMLLASSVPVVNSIGYHATSVKASSVTRYWGHGWRAGIPKCLNGSWVSNFKRERMNHHYIYSRLFTHENSRATAKHLKYGGIEPVAQFKNSKHGRITAGSGTGEFWQPQYRYIGHNRYVLIQGGNFKHGRRTGYRTIHIRMKNSRKFTWRDHQVRLTFHRVSPRQYRRISNH